MLQDHDADHVADVEGVSCRVDADICGGRALHELLLCSWHDILDHASPSEFFYKILHILFSLLFYELQFAKVLKIKNIKKGVI
jgi:hypothetical protein